MITKIREYGARKTVRGITAVLVLLTMAQAQKTPAPAVDSIATGLPVIVINTKDSASITSKTDYTYMAFSLTDPNDSTNNICKTGMNDRIRGRGNNSWRDFRARKKSYRIKFNEKTSLLGMEAAKDWVLLAQHRDETLLYNAIAFELGNRFAFPFNHKFQFVDVYMNGEYKGNYMLSEQNQVGAGRVDISKKEGWLVEFDEYYDKEPKFRATGYNLPVMIKSPGPGRPVSAADSVFDFVRNDINALANALASEKFPESGYMELIDVTSFIDFLLINEIVANTDLSHPRSTFLYKDKGGVIRMGPLWDFDSGYGWNYRNWMESGFCDHFNFPDKRPPVHEFFGRFYEDPAFLARYRERWNEMRDTVASVTAFIDEMAEKLKKSADLNFQHWWYKTYAPFTDTRFPQPNDFDDAIKRLKNWYNARVYYLNAEFNKVDILPKANEFGIWAMAGSISDTSLRTFTLISHGEMGELSARMRRGGKSAFEAPAGWRLSATGGGSHFASTGVRLKPALPPPPASRIYSDTLIISGTNRDRPFTLHVPLEYAAAKDEAALAPAVAPPKRGKSAKPRKKRWWRGWR